jgi:Ca-activated chloride channel family protein
MPPPEAVRIEELINYFDYDYPQPVSEHSFSITTELTNCPWNASRQLALIGIQGKRLTWKKHQRVI